MKSKMPSIKKPKMPKAPEMPKVPDMPDVPQVPGELAIPDGITIPEDLKGSMQLPDNMKNLTASPIGADHPI